MLPISLDNIDQEYLLDLPNSGVRETERLDYKMEVGSFPGSLLKAVCAFANSAGGDLIIGVEEGEGNREGYAENVDGIDLNGRTLDQLEQHYNQSIQSGIEPAPTTQIRCYQLDTGNAVVIVRIPKSAISPHRVRSTREFWRRAGTTSVRMDVHEIGRAFSLGYEIQRQAESLNNSRRFQPLYDVPGPKVSLVLIPHASLMQELSLDLSLIPNQVPLSGQLVYSHPDIDGRVHIHPRGDNEDVSPRSFFHIGRNGVLEDSIEISDFRGGMFYLSWYDNALRNSLSKFVEIARNYPFPQPAYLYLNLENVQGIQQHFEDRFFAPDRIVTLNRSSLSLGPSMIESWDEPIDEALKPLLDQLWNGIGADHCPNYNEQGEWAYNAHN